MKKRKLISREVTPVTINALGNESDRGCVILASAMLENILTGLHETFITGHLMGIDHPKDFFTSLTAQYGPLSDFSGKIKLAFAYGLIPLYEFQGLEAIRKLRNEAAHENIPFRFEDSGVQKLVAGLAGLDRIKYGAVEIKQAGLTALPEVKKTFICACCGLALTLMEKQIAGREIIKEKKESSSVSKESPFLKFK